MHRRIAGLLCLLLLAVPFVWPRRQSGEAPPLPAFGRDTVLVYRSSNENQDAFIVRIATFEPDRFIEWEDRTTQGTIRMLAKAVNESMSLVNFQLFEGGVDTKGKDATTLWLSKRLYRALKENPKFKFNIDGLQAQVNVLGQGTMEIDVNRVRRELPVIRIKDDRGAERWFLDFEENPLLANLLVRNYQEKLTSITTDRPNTLRWIKDKKK
jgi:hypothetical protein